MSVRNTYILKNTLSNKERIFLSEEKNLRDLLLQATKDPEFRMKLLKNPEVVAKEANVRLKPDQLEKIKKTAAFVEALDDIRFPPGPIFYPIDPTLNNWKKIELANVLRYIIAKRRWIFYPADVFNIDRIGRERFR